MTDEQKQSIARALGRVPSGIFILTAKSGEKTSAMMASWVQQASFEPPCVSVAIAKSRVVAEIIRESQLLALSIVPHEDKSLLKRYGKMKVDEDPFAGVNVKPAPSGVPILSDALAFLDCKVIDIYDFHADHDLYVAQIIAGDCLRDGTAFTHQRGNGFHY